MTIDSHDNILVALGSGKIGGDVIAEVTSSGAVSNYAAGLTTVSGLAFDASGNLYASEETHGKVIKIAPNGTQTTFATVPNEAEALVFDSKGNLFINTLSSYIYEVTPTGTMSQFTTATTVGSQAMAIDSHDNLYCTVGYEVDKITPSARSASSERQVMGGIYLEGSPSIPLGICM